MATAAPTSVLPRPLRALRGAAPKLPERTERRLAAGLAAGDPALFRALYDEYASTTFGFLGKALGDRGAAEDVQQQVFFEVWQRRASYDPERGSLLTWIMAIARSRAIDWQRKRRPVPVDPVDGSLPMPEAPDELSGLASDWRVAHLLRGLPRDESDLLRMRFVDDMSQSEIADATGVPLGTVKMRMVRGLERLRAALEREGEVAA